MIFEYDRTFRKDATASYLGKTDAATIYVMFVSLKYIDNFGVINLDIQLCGSLKIFY